MKKFTQLDSDLLKKQVNPLFEATRSGGLANIFAAWLVYALVFGTHYQENGLLLSIAVTVLSVVRILFSDDYLRVSTKNVKLYLGIHLSLTFVIGIAWGLFALMQSAHDDSAIRNMVFLINFGMIAGSLATLSIWVPAYIAYITPQAACIFAVLAIQNNSISSYMAAAFFVFIIIMISTSLKVSRGHKREMLLNLKNKELIDDLNDEVLHRTRTQVLLEDSKRDLEEKVRARTIELENINECLVKEIADKEKAEENLEYIAYHDELTNLPNRNLLIDRINDTIETAHRNNEKLGILFLDLDRFKAINDSLGHHIGDKLIQEVAKRLLHTLRKEDTISRNGGDEFVVVIKRMQNSDEAILIAQKLIENLTNIFEIDSHKIHIGASIGISVYPNDGKSAVELVRNADTAMFNAKKSGGNRLQFYDESMSNRLRERLILENELHTALQRDEFHMVYQPQVNCLTGQTVGFEALLRWSNKKLGTIGPDQFVPLLEETGLIYSVGKWVIKEVIELVRSGKTRDLSISINLSALQCGDIALVDFINNEIIRSGINPACIEFEITESLLINDFETTEVFLSELNKSGCSIALDDFGTGYTSMSYLTRLPIDCIKVDQSFISNIDSNMTLENIVKAIVNMSTSLGMKNVFEGVETEAELDKIKQLNGIIVQGYLYSRPLDVHGVLNWLAADRLNITQQHAKY
ncbi:EAL domain-containing protein [bacterium]|nr:EAL domain-containing protein [bacterium]